MRRNIIFQPSLANAVNSKTAMLMPTEQSGGLYGKRRFSRRSHSEHRRSGAQHQRSFPHSACAQFWSLNIGGYGERWYIGGRNGNDRSMIS